MVGIGFVQTPEKITEILLKEENFEGDILEPCCGKGAISKVLLSHGYSVKSSDIHEYGYGEKKDVFKLQGMYDNIITNPPFNNKLAVTIYKDLQNKYRKKLVLLWYLKNLGRIVEGPTGRGLKTVYIVGKIDWKETKLGWKFAWYVWEKGYEGAITIKVIR